MQKITILVVVPQSWALPVDNENFLDLRGVQPLIINEAWTRALYELRHSKKYLVVSYRDDINFFTDFTLLRIVENKETDGIMEAAASMSEGDFIKFTKQLHNYIITFQDNEKLWRCNGISFIPSRHILY